MTRRGSIVLYGALLLFSAAALLVSSSAAALGALALLIAFPLVSLAWNAFVRRAVQAEISLCTLASKNEQIQGGVCVRCGRGRIPVGRISAEAVLQNELTGTTEILPLELLPRKAAYAADFTLQSRHCGCVLLTLRGVVLSDVFELVRLRCGVQASARCTILPNTFPVEIADPALPNDTSEADTVLDAGGGSDFTEVYRLREYVPGDSIRGMHWKLSGKLDTLIYREPSLAVQRSLLLFWDKSDAAPDTADALAEAVFSVAQALSEQGIVFTLAVPQQGVLRLCLIPDGETLLQTLPLLLRGTQDVTALPDTTQFGRTLWFTAKNDAPASGTCTVLYCAEKPDADGHGIVFTPQTVRETLHRLDWNYET